MYINVVITNIQSCVTAFLYLCYDVIVLYTNTQLTGISRLQLAAIHFNHNADVVSSKAQRKTVVFPKQKKGEPAVKTVSDEPNFGMTIIVYINSKTALCFGLNGKSKQLFENFN